MRAVICGLSVVALALGSALVIFADDEEKVPLDKVPKAVMESVKKRFPNGEVTGASKETEDGKTTYEINVKDNGSKIDVELTPEGAIAVIEKQIKADGLPKAVTDALEGKYPKANHTKVEEIIKVKDGNEKLECYEILLVTADNKKFEVCVSPEGKITKEEEKKKKD